MNSPQQTQAREDICRAGKSLFDRGSVHATAGNISARLDNGFLITPYFVMKVGHVPVIFCNHPEAAEAASEVAQRITEYGQRSTPIRAVMLNRLGPNVWSNSSASVIAILDELEETAKLFCLQPNTAPISDAHIEELRQTFNAVW